MDDLLNEDLLLDADLIGINLSALFNGSFSENYTDYGDVERLFHITDVLHRYVLPVIILVGIIGNTANFLVFIGTPRLCRQSSSVYLAFLAVVDNVIMVTVLVVWFGWVGVHVFMKNGWCQTMHYCTYVCSFLSVWTVVSFTCERWIIVFHPLKRHHLCTRRRAVLVMTSLTVGALIFYSFSIFTTVSESRLGRSVCRTSDHYQSAQQIIRGVDTMITVIIPLLAIIIMNTAIGIKTCRYAGQKKMLQVPVDSVDDISGFTSANRPSETGTRNGQTSTLSFTATGRLAGPRPGGRTWRLLTRRRHTQLRITQALLVVSSVFVLLNLPTFVFHVNAFVISIRRDSLDTASMKALIWQELIQFLYYINFASRFFLHAASSRNFRCALKRLLTRLKHRLAQLSQAAEAPNWVVVFRRRN